jgi:hypothetical protein
MVFLTAFADAHPDPFKVIGPEDFVRYENDAFAGMQGWDVFASHCLAYHACNEECFRNRISDVRSRRRPAKRRIAEAFHLNGLGIESLVLAPNEMGRNN